MERTELDLMIEQHKKLRREELLNLTVRNWRFWVMAPFLIAMLIPSTAVLLFIQLGKLIVWIGERLDSMLDFIVRPFAMWVNRGVK